MRIYRNFNLKNIAVSLNNNLTYQLQRSFALKTLKGANAKSAGFTLIELLVVIAIIAILVVIVIVAINPVQRVNDASDRRSQSNVRATGTLLATCVAQQLTLRPQGAIEACGVNTAPLTNFGTVANNVRVWPSAAIGDRDVCAVQQGSAANFYVYRYLTVGSGATATAVAGTVTQIAGTAGATNATECP